MPTPPLCLLAAVLLLLAPAGAQETCSGAAPAPPRRGAWMSVAGFGAVGDGRTLNTAAFARAVARIERRRGARGGTLLYVPPGVWLTGPFNLTSHMTLFLARGAVIRATQDTSSWPLVDPLPSYGRGRELPGGRYMSLIHGNGLQDVFITGENGTIDGQGSVWWDMWKKRTLPFTRPHLLELLNFFSMGVGIHIKTNSGRGGYIRNITVSEVTLNGARYGLRIAGDVGGHPDTSYNPNVLPVVDSVTIKNVWGQNIRQAGLIRGIRSSVFSRICLSNVKLYGSASIGAWKCRDVSGGALDVQPSPCTELASTSETGFCTT
ncbi:hypothetical protein PVAP13_3KG207447 [Panicum virgatum]|uniref:Polygalacturonase n=1 Tax=Panicum virgatum TaxID=38727 RepID=A0A8T0UWS5_PANVG|nr:hypothetical protein PVAP13_3KG207447 [Panicum virgatum]